MNATYRYLLVLLSLACVLGAASCGAGGEQANAVPAVEKAEDGDVGKTIQSDEWAVVVLAQPERTKLVGSPGGGDRMAIDAAAPFVGELGEKEAEGMWVVLVVEVTNVSGDLAMLSKNLFTVGDSQGGSYPLASTNPHFSLIEADERWASIEDSQLVQYVFTDGDTRGGPLVFDVPEDATGLKLAMQGTEDTIGLGF